MAAANVAAALSRDASELERLPQQSFDGGTLGVRRRLKRDETRVLSGALEQSAAVIELAATVEEKGRVPREGADPNHVRTVDCVADDLPHVGARPRRLALITDLVSLRGYGLHHPAGGLHDGTHGRWHLLDVIGNGDFLGGGHLLVAFWQLLYGPLIAVGIAEVHEPAPRQVLDVADRDPALGKLLVRDLDIRHDHLQTLDRPGLHLRQSRADVDRARRTRRRQLDEAQILVDLLIVIGVEADLVDIKRLGPVDGRYRHRHQFNLPVHEFDFLLSVLSDRTLSIVEPPASYRGCRMRATAAD